MPDMLGSQCAAAGFVAAYALEYGLRRRQEKKCPLNQRALQQRDGASRQYGSDSGSSDRSSDRRVRFEDGLPKIENMYSSLANGKMLAGVAIAGLLAYQVNRKKDTKRSPDRRRYSSVDYDRDFEQGGRYNRDSDVIENEDKMGGPPIYKLRNGSEANVAPSSRSRSRSQSRFRTPVYSQYV